MKSSDPAVQHYWFGKAYSDLGRVIVSAKNANIQTAREYYARMQMVTGSAWTAVPLRIFYFCASCSVVVFGGLTWLATAPVHVAIILLIAAIVLISYFFADTAERLYMLLRGWRAFCKACRRPMPLPEFACPNCKAWHAALRPSRYGIFLRRCNCGQRMPSAYISGRNRLTARCPHCKEPINATVDVESANTIIGFVGAPSAGKSAYLTSLASTLVETYGPANGWTITFTSAADQQMYKRLVEDVRLHGVTGKTVDEMLPAFNFLITPVRNIRQRRQLFLCDVAGESFRQSDKLLVQQQMGHHTGCVFLLDPFALLPLQRAYDAQLRAVGAASSVRP